jgi:hypothetical protein
MDGGFPDLPQLPRKGLLEIVEGHDMHLSGATVAETRCFDEHMGKILDFDITAGTQLGSKKLAVSNEDGQGNHDVSQSLSLSLSYVLYVDPLRGAHGLAKRRAGVVVFVVVDRDKRICEVSRGERRKAAPCVGEPIPSPMGRGPSQAKGRDRRSAECAVKRTLI